MQSTEALQELLAAQQRENQRIRLETSHANLLLNALAALLTVGRDDDPFAKVFASLRDVFTFDMALMLVETRSGFLDCIAAEPVNLVGRRFAVEQVPGKVLLGRVAITFPSNASVGAIPRPLSDEPEFQRRAGLYLPIEMGGVAQQRGTLVLFAPTDGAGFDRTHVPLAQKFSLLVGHALETRRSNQQVLESETRARAAEQASSMKNMLIANMSHELRTPLNAILGFSDLMLQAQGENALTMLNREYVGHIHSGGSHLLVIVNNLLLLAKIGAGEHKARIETVDLAAELNWAVRLLSRDAQNLGIAIALEVPATQLPVQADIQSVRQIMLNVLGNALKFSPPGETVTLRAGPASPRAAKGGVQRIAVFVADKGPGMQPALLAELGTPFVQADDAFSRRTQGTGLGLAISYGLARAMDAVISIESEIGRGTVVEVAFRATTAGS